MMRIESTVRRGFLVASFALAASSAVAAENVVVKRFTGGIGLNSVGMIAGSEDAEAVVPQALYAGEGSKLYLLDQVNGRVLQFDAKKPGASAQAFELPSQLRPTDLVVRKNRFYVWDGSIHTLQAKGPEDTSVRGLDVVSTRGVDDQFVVSAFAQMGSRSPSSDVDLLSESTRSIPSQQSRQLVRQHVATRGRGLLTVDVKPTANLSAAEIEVRAAGQSSALATLRVQVRDRLGAVEFLDIDEQGKMFILTENVPSSSDHIPSAFVARYTALGQLETVYDIPLAESEALSRRYVTISGDGEVYFLRTRKNEVDVIGVGGRTVHGSSLIDNPAARIINRAIERERRLSAAVRPLSRKSVIETAFAFERHKWRVTPSSYGRDPDKTCVGLNRVRRPGYLAGKNGQEVRGIPYCWGCHGSLVQIASKLDRGMLAGNLCTNEDPRPDVVGVDCSAFISAAWGLSSHFTTLAIPSITEVVKDPWALQPGDALNKPGSHVMLFLRYTRDRKVEVIESSTRGCNGRVCRNIYPLTSMLARGYSPVRFRALAAKDAVAASETSANDAAERRSRQPRNR